MKEDFISEEWDYEFRQFYENGEVWESSNDDYFLAGHHNVNIFDQGVKVQEDQIGKYIFITENSPLFQPCQD